MIVNALCQHFGPKKLRKIISDDIEDYLAQRRKEPTRRGGQRSGSSVNRERAILSGIFKRAIKKGCYAGENPCRGVERYTETGKRTKIINDKEEVKMMAALNERDPILRYVAEIALKSGMRLAEVVSLRWEWLDFTRGKKGRINLPATICKNKKARSIPMLYNVRELLLELRGSEEKASGAVFSLDRPGKKLRGRRRKQFRSDHIDPVGTGQRIARLCDSIGLPDVSMHTLRHTFATRCLDAGVHPFIVKSWLGHATLAQTDYYSQLPFDVEENAVTRLDEKLGENGAKKGVPFPPDVPDFRGDVQTGSVSA